MVPALLQRLARMRGNKRPAVKRTLLALAAAFLVAGLVVSLRQYPDILINLRWGPILLLALVAVPFNILVNATEFVLIADMTNRKIPFWSATETTVLVTVANMLPIPSGAIVRVVALKAAGAGYGKGTVATLLAALVWLAVSLVYAGIWVALWAPEALGLSFVAAGSVLLAACVLIVRQQRFAVSASVRVVLVRLALVALDGFRIYLCFLALNIDATFVQASAFSVASAAGSAVSLIPGGLGVREGIMAALAPVMGLAAAIGFLASALNRMVDMPVMVPLAAVLSLRARRGQKPDVPAAVQSGG